MRDAILDFKILLIYTNFLLAFFSRLDRILIRVVDAPLTRYFFKAAKLVPGTEWIS